MTYLLMFCHSHALKESLVAHFTEVAFLGAVNAPDMHLEEPARAEDLAALLTHAGGALAVN